MTTARRGGYCASIAIRERLKWTPSAEPEFALHEVDGRGGRDNRAEALIVVALATDCDDVER